MSAELTELTEQLDLGLINQRQYDRRRELLEQKQRDAPPVQQTIEPDVPVITADPNWVEGKTTVEQTSDPKVRIEIEYKTSEEGKRVKIVRKIRSTVVEKRVLKRVMARRGIPKFGKCYGQPVATLEKGITAFGDVVKFDIPQEKEKEGEEDTTTTQATKTYTTSCRACGAVGDHWTKDCPYKDRLVDVDSLLVEGGGDGEGGDRLGGAPGAYRPPGARGPGGRSAGGRESRGSRMDQDLTIRVTNLPEDSNDQDIRELFGDFGSLQRVFLAKDRRTGLSRGFAFVSYYSRRDAEDALKTLQGYGYGNLILRLEWAAQNN